MRPSHLRLVGVWGNRVLKRLDMVALPLLSLLGAALVAIAFIFGELRDAAGATGPQIGSENLASVVDAIHWALRMVSIATSGLLAWSAALALRPCARNWMAGLQPLPRLGDYSKEARKMRRLEARAILAWLAAVTAAVSALAVIAMTPVLANALFSVLELS